MEAKYIACMVLHSLGDVIGYNNGLWDYDSRTNDIELVLERVYEFIDLGGINGIDISKWRPSANTTFHIINAKSLLHSKSPEEFVINSAKTMIEYYNANKFSGGGLGITLTENVKKLSSSIDKIQKEGKSVLEYNSNFGGSGASARTACIGLVYYNKYNELLSYSVENCKLTHNNAYGYIGGYMVAFFIHLALLEIPIKEWAFKFAVYAFPSLDKFIKNNVGDKEYLMYQNDRNHYYVKMERYLNIRFELIDKKVHIIEDKSRINLIQRLKDFTNEEISSNKNFIGLTGLDAVLLAYDSLLFCDGKWEKLVFYSMLHNGVAQTTGCIAGALYGATYGFGDVPDSNLLQLTNKQELIDLGKELFNKV